MSYNLKTAKSFLRQIKVELETNEMLKHLFPEILYAKPEKDSIKWSEQEGLVVKRKKNRKEPTFSSFGLVDSQATGMHFTVHSFDDAVTQDSVTTAEMIDKTTRAWQLSDNIGMSGKVSTRKKYAGTRYHFHDTYKKMLELDIPHTIITATEDGTAEGKPIFLTQESLEQKRKVQGSYIFSCQMLLNPIEKADQKFTRDMIRYYDSLPVDSDGDLIPMDFYLAVDPANEKKKESDYTAGLIFGFSPDRKIYLIDGFHDKISLGERYREIKAGHNKYQFRRVGYEKYGLQTDMDYFRMENEKTNFFMPLFQMKGSMSKEDRILRLVALFENGDILFPKHLYYDCKFDNEKIDIIERLLFEMFEFPMCKHDDLLDCLSRVLDLFFNDPSLIPERKVSYEDTQTAGYRFEQILNRRSEE